MVLIFILYALFASTFILGREAALACPPVFFIGIRMILAGILLVGFVRIFKKESFTIQKNELFWFSGIVLFHIYGSYVLEFIGMQYLTGAKVALLYNLSPFITALLSYLFLREVMSAKKWLGLLIGFLAFIPVLITTPTSNEMLSPSLGFLSVAELLLIFSVISACIGWIFMKKLIRDYNHSYIFVNGVGMLLGGILALATSYFFETWPSIHSLSHNVPFLRSLFLLIFVGNIISYNLYGKLLHDYSTTTLSFFGACTPLFAALFGWLWLGETVSPWFYVTAVLVGIGLYIFYKEELKDGILAKRKQEEKDDLVAAQEEDAAR